ncbi:MAG: hypothetical protein ACE5D7_09610, partial [Fidelibacterota bacterium]
MKLKRFGNSIKTFSLIIFLILSFITLTSKSFAQTTSNLKFDVSFPSEIYDSPITGRVYLIISKDENREPRFQVRRSASPPFFGKDVVQLNPGQAAVIDDAVLGFPLNSIKDIPPGEYYAQGFINIYTKFKRSDGHTIYLHNDQWEGQQWNRSPGNLYSDVLKVNIDPSFSQTIQLSCNNVIPPIKIPPDTKWVKRIRIKSKILSDFWGQSIYLGATILLPKDYEKNRHRRYPVNYIQGHFSLRAPNGFRTEQPDKKDRRGNRGYEFYKSWIADDSPRMIFVTFQHPCPYFDDSYAVNSANCGPYGDAIMKELIPTIESR